MEKRGDGSMAAGRRAEQMNRQVYVYGNTVRKAEVLPRQYEEEITVPKKRASVQVRRNRRNAMHMNAGYVVFLSVAAVLALAVCVLYLQLQTEVTNRSEQITALQQQLASQKEENTTRYNSIMDSMNLNDIRSKAVNELGMVYASKEQVIAYTSPTNDYVKQYEAIPESGILARSDNKE